MEEMKKLIETLNQACVAYYRDDSPIMSDHEYDRLYDRLAQLEKETGTVLAGSPTQKVQGYLLEGFQKVQHSKPMLSAAKTKDIKEISNFLNGYEWYCSGKLDGLTLVVIYEDGEFRQGITRGNGIIGEDVTGACRFIKNLPMRIPYKERLELRGECVMSWNEFNRINDGLTEKYSHPRNLAAGTLRQLDLNVVKERELSFVVFESVTDLDDSKFEELDYLRKIGFETVIRCGGHDVETITDTMTKLVQDDKYPYDGLIFEIDSKRLSKRLGATAHHPNERMAFKWLDQTYETTLRDIEWVTGKTGVIFPTGIVDPVDLDGAVTERVTLHNVTYIRDLELGIGDTVTMYRSNKVIPAIDENLTRSNTYVIPDTCPACGESAKIIKENKSEILFCTNKNCPGRLLGKWKHYVSRNAMNVDGLSEQTLDRFLKRKYINGNFWTLYDLPNYKTELYRLDGFGKKSIDNILTAIEKSRDVNLQRFINAFSVPGIGEGQAKLLATKFKTFDAFAEACEQKYRFDNISGIGEVLNSNIHQWWRENKQQMINVSRLMRWQETKTASGDALNGKTFCITGSVNHFKNRDELKKKIESLGGKVASGVSKSTNFLINNDVTSTSGKNKKAMELGIKIISEEDFIRMCDT